MQHRQYSITASPSWSLQLSAPSDQLCGGTHLHSTQGRFNLLLVISFEWIIEFAAEFGCFKCWFDPAFTPRGTLCKWREAKDQCEELGVKCTNCVSVFRRTCCFCSVMHGETTNLYPRHKNINPHLLISRTIRHF